MLDTWIDSVAHGRTNIAPKDVPWDMIRTLITEMYGGKIDDEADFRTLNSLVEKFMTPAAFEENFKIVKLSSEQVAALDEVSKSGLTRFVYPEFGINFGFQTRTTAS